MNGVWDDGTEHEFNLSSPRGWRTEGALRARIVLAGDDQPHLFTWTCLYSRSGQRPDFDQDTPDGWSTLEQARDAFVASVQGALMRGQLLRLVRT